MPLLRRLLGRSPTPNATSSRVTVRNGGKKTLLVIFEPWCQTYDLVPDAELVFEAVSPRPGWLTVDWSPDAATVYAWDACVARVFDLAGSIIDTLDTRVPDFSALDEQASRHGSASAG